MLVHVAGVCWRPLGRGLTPAVLGVKRNTRLPARL